MVNAWSLLYEELNGTMDEVYPVMTDNTITPQEGDEYDPITTVGSGNTATYTISDDVIIKDYREGETFNVSLNDDFTMPNDTPTPGIELDNPRKYR